MKNLTSAPRNADEGLISDDFLVGVFARIDGLALGLATGLVVGASLFAATAFLLLKGGILVGPHLGLLAQYIPGYSVTWTGSLVGFGGGFVAGFAVGWSIAFLRNLLVAIYMYVCALLARLDRFLDDV
jgi:hypothetical protein